jgi:hypothetical protein
VLPPGTIAAWLPQLAAALDYLHREAGVAHGDLKPANVLLRRDGVVKLADFGVARELALSPAAGAGGTLAYLSPQRVLGTAPGPADDLYALGALLYELLTGRPPFFEGDVAAQIELLAPEPLATRRRRLGVPAPDAVPPAWERVIQSCLAKRAADRPATAGEIASGLGGSAQVPAWHRPGVRAAGAVVFAVLTAAAWWWRAGPPPPPRPAAARAVTEFAESFDSGLAGWVRWGEPPPRLVSAYQGRTWVFDNNGDGMHTSGATSMAVVAAPTGFELRSDVRLDVANPAGCHLDAWIGLTFDPANWMNALGSEGDNGFGVRFGITYVGDTCWGSHPEYWRHAYFGAWFTAEDGRRITLDTELPREAWVADRALNRWSSLRIAADAERRVRFFAGNALLWAPEARLHPRVLAGQRVVVFGRSAGSAGKAYHDELELRAAPGGVLQVSATPVVAVSSETRLPWGDAAWTQRTAGSAAPVPWPEGGDELLLTAPDGGALALRTRAPLRGFAAVEFDVQPFLNSGGAAPDVLTIFVEQRTAGGWRRWVAELSGTEIRLAERAPGGRETAATRIGTYGPGAWATLVFTRTATGAVTFVGSRLQPHPFASPASAGGEWALGFELSGSADGAAVRPPRVSTGPR